MAKALLIAEKPSLMREIQDAYNKKGHPDQITFKTFVGHTMGLKMPADYTKDWEKRHVDNLPMIPKKFEYKPTPDKMAIYKELKEEVLSGKYDYIINACDPGREGQHIFFSFYHSIGATLPVKRMWHADLTVDELSRALNNLLDESSPRLTYMTHASKLRAFFDWLVGMNYSSGFSLAANKNISTGRVMSPALRIVVDRELEIANFVSKPFWNVEGDFGNYKGMFQAKDGDAYQTNFEKKDQAEAFIKDRSLNGVVSHVEQKKQSQKAPQLFSLQSLSTQASKNFGYSMSETLKITQGLYEKKLVSYPRTDSPYLTSAISKSFSKLLKPLLKVPSIKDTAGEVILDTAAIARIQKDKRYVDDKKVTDHYAITPTGLDPVWDKLTQKEQNIYELIAKRFLAIFLPPLVTNKTKIITDIDGYDFLSNGSVLVDKGFTVLYGYNPQDSNLPAMSKGDKVTVKAFNLIEKKTTPPARYTDGTLGSAMENAGRFVDDKDMKDVLKESKGIGTPATRGAIVDKLVQKNMIGYQKKAIYATEYGISLIQNLNGHDVTSVEMTAEWESKLTDVEDGKLSASDFYKEMVDYITRTTNDIKGMKLSIKGSSYTTKGGSKGVGEVIGACPKCQGEVKIGKTYYLCEHYKDSCDFIFGRKQWGASISKTEAKKLLAGKPTKELKFENKGKKWEGSLVYDDKQGRVIPTFASGNANANGTKKKSSVSATNVQTADGEAIKENTYYYFTEESDYKVPKEVWGVRLTEDDAKSLLDGKELPPREFTWSSGKRSKAKLSFNKGTNKIQYNFK